jgi:hypothetical protein
MENDRQAGVVVAPARGRPGEERGGVSFAQVDGRRSTSATGRAILADAAAAAAGVDSELARWILFAPDTTRVLMAAPLVHDLSRAPATGRYPENPFSDGAAHGGLWRAAYGPGSVLGIAAPAGLPHTLMGRTPVA